MLENPCEDRRVLFVLEYPDIVGNIFLFELALFLRPWSEYDWVLRRVISQIGRLILPYNTSRTNKTQLILVHSQFLCFPFYLSLVFASITSLLFWFSLFRVRLFIWCWPSFGGNLSEHSSLSFFSIDDVLLACLWLRILDLFNRAYLIKLGIKLSFLVETLWKMLLEYGVLTLFVGSPSLAVGADDVVDGVVAQLDFPGELPHWYLMNYMLV